MTGQVKEEILTRLGELGLRVESGRIIIRPTLLREREWLEHDARFEYLGVGGVEDVIDLPPASLAFTFCQVPVVYHRREPVGARVTLADGTASSSDSLELPEDVSAHVFARSGWVKQIDVLVGEGPMPTP